MREHDSFGPAAVRRGRRKFDDDDAELPEARRGSSRACHEDPDLPETGDRWSTWDGALHGPQPRPDWVRTEHGAVDTELGMLKTGKEADVFLVRRALPGTDQISCWPPSATATASTGCSTATPATSRAAGCAGPGRTGR